MYKLKLTLLQQGILRHLFVYAGESFNAHKLSKELNVSQPAISKALPLLEKEGLILLAKDKESKRLEIKLNRDDHRIIWLKRVDNLKQLYGSGLVDFLYENYQAASTITLFGSYSMGEDTINSDIDIAIIGSKEKKINLEKYERILKRPININHYNSFKKIDNNLRNNILRGIVLKGWIEL